MALKQKLTMIRSHFNKDLEPYTCISEQCQDPPLYFASIRRWQKHMTAMHTTHWTEQIHKPRFWYCDLEHADQAGPPSLMKFDSVEKLRDHFLVDHSHDLLPARINSKLRTNVLALSRPSGTCPFCDFVATVPTAPEEEFRVIKDLKPMSEDSLASKPRVKIQALEPPSLPQQEESSKVSNTRQQPRKPRDLVQSKLSKHIGQHLKSLAFLSLRWFEEVEDDLKGSNDNINGTRSWGSSRDHEASSFAGLLSSSDEEEDRKEFTALHTTARYFSTLSRVVSALGFQKYFARTMKENQQFIRPIKDLELRLKTERDTLRNSLTMLFKKRQSEKIMSNDLDTTYSMQEEKVFRSDLDEFYPSYTASVERGLRSADKMRELMCLSSDFSVSNVSSNKLLT
jgi:hypothetical protein